LGPFPSGAPAIFIDTVARLGHKGGIIGAVGNDDFGSCILKRLAEDGVDCRYINKLPGTTATAFVTYFKNGSRKSASLRGVGWSFPREIGLCSAGQSNGENCGAGEKIRAEAG